MLGLGVDIWCGLNGLMPWAGVKETEELQSPCEEVAGSERKVKRMQDIAEKG